MAFKVHHAADGTQDIYRDGQAVGRIRGRTVELHGFRSRAEAERAVDAVSDALDRSLRWLRNGSRLNERPVVGRLISGTGMLVCEITAPPAASADQVLQVARTALHAAFGSGRRFGQRSVSKVV
ncbi:MAG: hypothetical protein ACREX3_03375 [Gammaproteobacteria bacterium]